MIHFLRRIRKRLIAQNRVQKYLLYAIGEILLVVIGIIIALQVNNWNTQKEQDRKTVAIINQVIDELIIDINVIEDASKFYMYKDSLIDVYRKTNLKNLPKKSDSLLDEGNLIDLIRTFAPVEIHDRGFNLLMDQADQVDPRYKEYIDDLVFLYEDVKPLIDLYYSRLKTMLYEHRMHKIKNHPWYSRMNETEETNNKEFDYYKFDPVYKNYMRFYNDMIYNITLSMRNFQDRAVKFCRKANINFTLGRDLDKKISFSYPTEKMLNSIKGKYLIGDKDTLTFTVKNKQLYESTYDDIETTDLYSSRYKVGELRYLGDSVFYRNFGENLQLTKEGNLSIINITRSRTTLLKRIER